MEQKDRQRIAEKINLRYLEKKLSNTKNPEHRKLLQQRIEKVKSRITELSPMNNSKS